MPNFLKNAATFLTSYEECPQNLFADVGLAEFAVEKQKKINTLPPEQRCKHYRLEDQFSRWPINQIGNLPLFAAMGFHAKNVSDSNHIFYPAGFFESLKKVKYVVAIGQPGKDFPAYFKNKPQLYYGINQAGDYISVSVKNNHVEQTNFVHQQYHVTCHFQNLNTLEETSHQFDVFNIDVPDGTAIQFEENTLYHFTAKLLSIINQNEGIVVHCKAGLGRTGQLLGEILLALRDQDGKTQFEKIFSTADKKQILKNIYHFVEDQLRAYRPGLILQPEQLLQMLINGYYFKNELIKRDEAKAKYDQQVTLFAEQISPIIIKEPEHHPSENLPFTAESAFDAMIEKPREEMSSPLYGLTNAGLNLVTGMFQQFNFFQTAASTDKDKPNEKNPSPRKGWFS